MHTPHMSIQALEWRIDKIRWVWFWLNQVSNEVQHILNRRMRSCVHWHLLYNMKKVFKNNSASIYLKPFYLKPVTVAMSGYNSYLVCNLELCL